MLIVVSKYRKAAAKVIVQPLGRSICMFELVAGADQKGVQQLTLC